MSYTTVSALDPSWNFDDDRLNVNGDNHDNNNNGCAFGIALVSKTSHMKTHNDLYPKIISKENLYSAFRKARKRKTKKEYVKEFSKNLKRNISELRIELLLHSYIPKQLRIFILRDPKTRKISKAHFRDRIVHHALCNIIEPIFDKTFIHDSYANRKGKGTLAALQRFDKFKRKISKNGKLTGWFNTNHVKGYCLKADIKHYFEEIDHKILLEIIRRKIICSKTIWLIKKILTNYEKSYRKGMPLGNLTSQFFANVYLNELDYFVKHKLRAKFYIRYVDDFIILHSSKEQLNKWKEEINSFLKNKLRIELHPDKSRIILSSRSVPFVGFKVFYYHKLLKKFNRKNIQRRLDKFQVLFLKNEITYDKIYESMQGSFAYMKHANTYKLRKRLSRQMETCFPNQISSIEINRYLKYSQFYYQKKK